MTIKSTLRAWLTPALLAAAAAGAYAAPGQLIVGVNKPGIKISPTFFGLMTEEINHSYDGGLYGELIQNRALKDDANGPAHWSVVTSGGAGTISLDKGSPIPGTALTNSLRLDVSAATAGQHVGVANEGYWGIPVKPHTTYRASFYAKAGPAFTGPLTVDIESNDGETIHATAQVPALTAAWKPYTVTLTTGAVTPSTANRFVLSASSAGTVWLSQVSLMPPTYKNRPNGSRIDLMQKMGDMQPAFLRMPGGNYLEGNTIAERFEWKDTIGPIDRRPGHQGPWGYRSTDGMGLLEMLEWCEDLKMQPVLAVFAGYALRGEHIPAGPGLTPFVQDALDEIEYVTGGANTTWGARRVRDGHPAPFPLTYVEIGNEDFFDRSDVTGSYDGRFTQFYDAIKAKYPRLQLIATTPIKSRKPDLVDDHYYRSAAAMARDSAHYDKTDRSGPKIFVGEWASTEGSPTPTLQAALGDAAWMTGMERNSDLVVLEAYAPLLVNVNPRARQWGTNLIGYDALSSFGSPSYYVQKMFGTNRGDVILPITLTPQGGDTPVAAPLPSGRIGVATWATQAEFKDIQVTQGGKTLYAKDFAQGAGDWTLGQGQWAARDGVLSQTGDQTNDRATAGDTAWTDYTYHVQARKLSGREGFLIAFHYRDDANLVWWNIGGWGNTRTALEQFQNGADTQLGPDVPLTVEPNRWYDIRIEVQGRAIRCFLDGKLIEAVTDTPPAPPAPLYAVASRALSTGDIILKVVNTSPSVQQIQVDLQGARDVAKTAVAQVLAGDPAAVNTVDAPEKVAPQTTTLTGMGRTFLHEFPAHSVTVLRVRARK
jgi:alpha-L-arabinofuranosidase